MDLLRQIEPKIKPEWDNLKVAKKKNDIFEDCEPNMLIGWTDKNPSIWDVSDNPKKPTLESILVALCRRIKGWDKIAYIIFKKESVEKARLHLTPTPGNTSDQKVDTSNTHYEIKGITAKQLSALIYYITIDQFETGIFKKTEYDKILIEAYEKTQALEITFGGTSQTPEIITAATSSTKDTERTRKKMAGTAPETQIEVMPSSGTKK